MIMAANPNTRAIEDHRFRSMGVVWNLLHSEREDICDVLLKEPVAFGPNADARRTSNWHKELLQARLRRVDDALDRLFSGSYGHCCKCGMWIENTKLEFDPAIAFCIDCWQRKQEQEITDRLTVKNRSDLQANTASDSADQLLEGVALETLAPFDTIRVRTRNSDYRLFMLDPRTGRALIEGGREFVEPVEARVTGSRQAGSIFKVGWIGIGLRMEFWSEGKIVSTSPVESFHVEHNTATEPAFC
jgi:hypothetical protein